MESILNPLYEFFPYLKGIIHPLMIILFSLSGYVATDRLQLHLCIPFLYGQKNWAVFICCIPIGIAYMIEGVDWIIVLLNFMLTNSFYTYILRYGKDRLHKFFTKIIG